MFKQGIYLLIGVSISLWLVRSAKADEQILTANCKGKPARVYQAMARHCYTARDFWEERFELELTKEHAYKAAKNTCFAAGNEVCERKSAALVERGDAWPRYNCGETSYAIYRATVHGCALE